MTTNAQRKGASNGESMIASRVAAIDWNRIASDLDAAGWARFPALLTPEECGQLAELYADDNCFRSKVVMARHGFGRGEYKYFSYPLPDLIANLRPALYARLAPIANRWNEVMGIAVRYPQDHAEFLVRCHEAGQPGRRRCCFSMSRATTTACIRIFTEITSFRFRSCSCCRSRARIFPAANWC